MNSIVSSVSYETLKYEVDHDPDFCSVDDIPDDFGVPSRRRVPQILSPHGFETHEAHLRSKTIFSIFS